MAIGRDACPVLANRGSDKRGSDSGGTTVGSGSPREAVALAAVGTGVCCRRLLSHGDEGRVEGYAGGRGWVTKRAHRNLGKVGFFRRLRFNEGRVVRDMGSCAQLRGFEKHSGLQCPSGWREG